MREYLDIQPIVENTPGWPGRDCSGKTTRMAVASVQEMLKAFEGSKNVQIIHGRSGYDKLVGRNWIQVNLSEDHEVGTGLLECRLLSYLGILGRGVKKDGYAIFEVPVAEEVEEESS
jgi:hypothetical protein